MSEILVNTIKKADGTGGLTVPTTAGDIVTTGGATFTGAVTGTDLTLSGGVVFGDAGGSGTSKTLDDYEEGTFTPTWSSGTPTYTVQEGQYCKIGNRVFFDIRLSTSTISGMSDAWINGLPFTIQGSGNYGVSGNVFGVTGFQNLGDAGITTQYGNGTTQIQLYIRVQGSGANYISLDSSHLDEGGVMTIQIGGSYQTTA